jgi:tetratricopeptide (TPR) repeat protein
MVLAVTAWLTPMTHVAASDLGQLGDESFPWVEVATTAAANSEAAPMYRLPAVEVEKFAPAEIAVAEPATEPACVGEPTPEMLAEMEHAWVEVMTPNAVATAPLPSDEPPATPAPAPSPQPLTPPPYAPTLEGLSKQLLPSVQRAYGLAKNGAAFAAQTEFIQVLRRIAQAKDAAGGTDLHSRSLAAGLRALDEADDFMPQGAELEAEVNVMVIASAHRTPVLAQIDASTPLRSDEVVALYHHFARLELGRAVAGEQAGSMALYGLGKVQNRLAQEAQGELRHERRALTLFQAALDAGPSNHFAANEIGVLLSRSGRHVDAAMLFRRAINVAPSSTSYHNLAVVERKLGYHEYASANEQYAQHLAARDRAAGANSLARNVHWVNPQDLTRVTSAEPNMPPQSVTPQMQPLGKPASSVGTVAKWPQKLVPGVFRR